MSISSTDTTPDRGLDLAVTNVTLVSVAIVSISLRCYTRVFIVKSFKTEDWLMLIATFLFVCLCTSSLVSVYYGTGHHEADLSPENVLRAKETWWICYILYPATMMASKVSIGVFLLRVTVNRVQAWLVWFLIALSIFGCTGFLLVAALQCMPVQRFWDPAREGICVSGDVMRLLTIIYSAGSLLVDVAYVLLPIAIVWRLQLSLKAKAGLSVILSLGLIASVGVSVRFAYVDDFKEADFLYNSADLAIWSIVEAGCAVTAGSLATLKPLIRYLAQRTGWAPVPSLPRQLPLPPAGVGYDKAVALHIENKNLMSPVTAEAPSPYLFPRDAERLNAALPMVPNDHIFVRSRY